MNYQRIYNLLIERAISAAEIRVLHKQNGGYYERHHIIPRCMGGTNDKENLVELTAREHFICHMLLARAYPNNTKLWYAAHAMAVKLGGRTASRSYQVSSRQYAEIKSNLKITDKTRQKISESNKGRIGPWLGKSLTETHKQRISEGSKGRVFTAEHLQKLQGPKSETHKENMRKPKNPARKKRLGVTDVTRLKISQANKGKTRSEEQKQKLRKPKTEEWKRMHSERMKGRTPWNKGICIK